MVERYKSYLDFLNLVNLSNNLRVQVNEQIPHYSLYVGKGNNSALIKNLFRTYRPWWILEESGESQNINLYWYQLRQN